MDSGRFTVAFLLLLFATSSLSELVIRMPSGDRGVSVYSGVLSSRKDEDLFCESWKFSIENNDAGNWSCVPKMCLKFVQEYLTGELSRRVLYGERYLSDSEVLAKYALKYAKSVNVTDDDKDIWIFDIDETLLSNLPYYANHGFGCLTDVDENSFDEWVDSADAPALPASLCLYTELQQLGFKIFLLTGRSENQRNSTEKNLQDVGYTNYKRLILRGPSDSNKTAILYKSEKRRELKHKGYIIHGSSGDQWSDLLGFAIAKRSFKLPNPMYYIA